MSLGCTNPYLPVWPIPKGGNTFGDCSCCGSSAGRFYDVLCIAGGFGGSGGETWRDFATPARIIVLVGDFTELKDSLWNDDPGASAFAVTTLSTRRIAKIYLRDTGQGVRHPQVSLEFSINAGFDSPPFSLKRNYNYAPGGVMPVEVFAAGSMYNASGPPPNITWSLPSRTDIFGTTYPSESFSAPIHKIAIGTGSTWMDEATFAGNSFRVAGYGTPGTAHAKGCTQNMWAAGIRGADWELMFPEDQGSTRYGYDATGTLTGSISAGNNLYSARVAPQTYPNGGGMVLGNLFCLGGYGAVGPAGTPNEIAFASFNHLVGATPPDFMLNPWFSGGSGGGAAAADVFPFPLATNAGSSYPVYNLLGGQWPVAALRLTPLGVGTNWAWVPGYGGGGSIGGILVDRNTIYDTLREFAGETWNVTLGDVPKIFDCDADGRLYFGWDVINIGASSVNGFQLFRADAMGSNAMQMGTFTKNGAPGAVWGCQIVCDPAYGGTGIAHAVVVGDFDAYTPPAGASSTAEVKGLIGIACISIRDSQSIAQQSFWPGRFATGATVVNTGDWLPGLVALA